MGAKMKQKQPYEVSSQVPPHKKVKRVYRNKLYVLHKVMHPLTWWENEFRDYYMVVSPVAYRKGYFPHVELIGEYLPDPRDLFILGTGFFALERETPIRGTDLARAMQRSGVFKAFYIGRGAAPSRAMPVMTKAQMIEAILEMAKEPPPKIKEVIKLYDPVTKKKYSPAGVPFGVPHSRLVPVKVGYAFQAPHGGLMGKSAKSPDALIARWNRYQDKQLREYKAYLQSYSLEQLISNYNYWAKQVGKPLLGHF